MKRKMKRFIKLMIALLLFSSGLWKAQGQEPVYKWGVTLNVSNSSETITINKPIIDVFGNVYYIGYFKGTADFDIGHKATLAQNPSNELSGCISKYDKNGKFLWVRHLPNTNGWFMIYDLQFDQTGNVYISSNFRGVDFDVNPDPNIVERHTATANTSDILLLKLDSDGNTLWTKVYKGSGDDFAFSINPISSGIMILGCFNGNIDFGPSANFTTRGGFDNYILKLDFNGELIWAKQIGGIATDDRGSNVVESNDGNLYLSLGFKGTVDFDPGQGIMNFTSNGGRDIAFLKITNDGDLVWAKHYGGSGEDVMRILSLDNSGNILANPLFDSPSISFGPTVTFTTPGNSGNYTYTIGKFDPNGDPLWMKKIIYSRYYSGISSLFFDNKKQDIYCGGLLEGTVDLDPGSGIVNTTSRGGFDGFLIKLDGSGNYIWSKTIGNYSNNYTSFALSTTENALFGSTNTMNSSPIDLDPNVGIANFAGISTNYNSFIFKWALPFPPTDPAAFVTVWNPGTSTQIGFPGLGSNYTIKVYNELTNTLEQSLTATSSIGNPYTVTGLKANTPYRFEVTPGSGTFNRFVTYVVDTNWSANDKDKLTEVRQWGNIIWSSMEFAFFECQNMDVTATDLLTLPSNCMAMFHKCTSLLGNNSFNSWNTIGANNMLGMFQAATQFNQPLNNWNTNNVTNMREMFGGASQFNQPLNDWNTSNVEDMMNMFERAKAFNQPLNNWNTAKVKYFGFKDGVGMFYQAESFNQNLGSWDLSSMVDGAHMFSASGMSCENYSNTLVGWANNSNTSDNVMFASQATMHYNTVGAEARNKLIAKGWKITDDAYYPDCATAFSGTPDLTPNLFIANPNLNATSNLSSDMLVTISDLLRGGSNQQMIFRFLLPANFNITVPGITLSSTDQAGVSGTTQGLLGTVNNINGNFLFRVDGRYLYITSKPGYVLPPATAPNYSQIKIGFSIAPKASATQKTETYVTFGISPGSGGETVTNNNIATSLIVFN